MFNNYVDKIEKDKVISDKIKVLYLEIQEAYDELFLIRKNGIPIKYIFNKLREKVTGELTNCNRFNIEWNSICNKIGWLKN